MTKLGSIVLIANKDVKKSEKISIQSLLVYEERRKEFEISSDIKSGVTKIKVDIPKVGTFETKANTTKKKGEKTSLYAILPYSDLNKELTASEDVKKSDKLEVSVETISAEAPVKEKPTKVPAAPVKEKPVEEPVKEKPAKVPAAPVKEKPAEAPVKEKQKG